MQLQEDYIESSPQSTGALDPLSAYGALPPTSEPGMMTPSEVREAVAKLAQQDLDPVGRAKALADLKSESKLPKKHLEKQLAEEEKRLKKEKAPDQAPAIIEISETDIELSETLLSCDDLYAEFNTSMKVWGYPVAQYFTDMILNLCVSRSLDHGTGWVFTGPSSSGKSDIPRTGLNLLPPEHKKVVTSASSKALYYIGDIKNKVLGFGEIKNRGDEKDSEVQESCRQLISENQIVRVTVEPQEDGTVKSIEHVTVGPAAFTFSTTAEPSDFCDELVNRCFWIPADTSLDTNRSALSAIASKHTEEGVSAEIEALREAHSAKWRAFFKCLPTPRVVVPFAQSIIPSASSPSSKRLFKQVLDLVIISAQIHQKRRTARDGKIYAGRDDYERAYVLAEKCCPLFEGSEKITTRQAYEELAKKYVPGFGEFNLKEAMAALSLPRSTTQDRLRDMKRLGWLEEVDKSPKNKTYRLVQNPQKTSLGLVPPDQVESYDPKAENRSADVPICAERCFGG